MAPDYPDSARELNAGPATVLAEVTVGADGKPTDVTIYKSSGNMAMDREAIRAARASKYVPKLIDCKSVTGQYLFRAEFNPYPRAEYISAPRFSPPNGWRRNPNPSPARGRREFGEWTNANSVVGIMGGLTSAPLAQYVAQRIAELTSAQAQIKASESVPLCNGTVGWRLLYSQGGTSYAEVLQIFGDRLYEAYYYSTAEPPSKTVTTSLSSLCGS